MIEYQKMAKYYDLFYSHKNYDKEVNFLENIISKKNNFRCWLWYRNSYAFT